MNNEDFRTFDELLDLVPRPSTLKITENCWYHIHIDEPYLIRSKKATMMPNGTCISLGRQLTREPLFEIDQFGIL